MNRFQLPFQGVRATARRILIPALLSASLFTVAAAALVATASHSYDFNEGSGSVVLDSRGTVNGLLGPDAYRTPEGAIGFVGRSTSDINWGTALGQFGTDDFRVSFRIRSTGWGLYDILGNRDSGSHGNFFQIRMSGGRIVAEIDQDWTGTNYNAVVGSRTVNDGAWHEVTVTREGPSLALEVDGTPDGASTGYDVAHVANGVDFRAGSSPVADWFGLNFVGELDDIVISDPNAPSDVTPPTISGLSVSRATLTPPNHKMVDIRLDYTVSDAVDSNPTTTVTVTSNEPDNGLGDGDTAGDIEVVNSHLVRLRAERSGKGSGRIYTITVKTTDASGNFATATTFVTVPKGGK